MRIGYEYLIPGNHDTGVGTAVRELLAALVRVSHGMRFEVFALKRPTLGGLRTAKVSVHRPGLPRLGRMGRIVWQQAGHPLSLLGKRLALYHATAYAAGRFHLWPTVLSVYDLIALEHPELTRPLNAAHFQWTMPRALRAASHVVTPSEHVRQAVLRKFALPEDRVTAIPLGVKPSCLWAGKAVCAPEAPVVDGLPRGASYILFVGNLEQKKNLQILIRAFSACRRTYSGRLYLVLAGRRGRGWKSIAACIEQEGIADAVLTPGYIPEEGLPRLYQHASVFAYPCIEEGFGLPPLEAMACGAPVAAARSGALPEVLGDAAVFVDPTDVAGWRAALERAIDDQETRQVLQARGRLHSRRFTWEAAAQATLDVYRRVTGGEERTA